MKHRLFSLLHAGLVRNWPALSVFVLCLLLTLCGFMLHRQDVQQNIVRLASHDADEYQRTLAEGAHSYVHLNRDMAGFFAASGDVTAREFNIYAETVNAMEMHPGLGYIGFVPRIAIDSGAAFEAKMRKSIPSFKIHGAHADPGFVYPLVYAFPQDLASRRFAGFDFSGIPERWEAMQAARDLGKSFATRKHAHLKSTHDKNIVFIFTPIYRTDKPVETIAERRAALTGFVISTFDINEVVNAVMGARFNSLFDLEIYDGQASQENMLYDGDRQPYALARHPLYPIAHQGDINFAGRTWGLYLYPKRAYFDEYADRRGWLVLFSGGLISIVLAFLTAKWLRHRRARRFQLEQGERFQAVFENHPFAVYSLDLQGRLTNANAKAIQALGLDRDKLIGTSAVQFIDLENAARARERFQEVLNGNAVSYETAFTVGAGKRLDLSIVLIPVSSGGEISGVLGIAENITERRLAESRLEESRRMLRLVIDNIPQRVFWKNTEFAFLGCNKLFCEDAGVARPAQVKGKTDYDFPWKAKAGAYRQDDRETMQSGIAKINYEEQQLRQDGSEYWLRTSKIPLTNHEGETIGVLGLYEDITERKLLEKKLEQMAHYDSLTGLPNRAFFYDQLQQALSRSKRRRSQLALMYFDIDKFKLINDSCGHDIGDAVIGLFAKRVKAALREPDIVARLGGDEFCLILEDLPARQDAQVVAAKLIEAMRPLFQIGERLLQISTSIGIAFHRPDMAADELIRRADHAMYQAKRSGRNRFEMECDDSALREWAPDHARIAAPSEQS